MLAKFPEVESIKPYLRLEKDKKKKKKKKKKLLCGVHVLHQAGA